MRVDQVVLVVAGQVVQRVQGRDRILERSLDAGRQEWHDGRFDACIAGNVVDEELFVPRGPAEAIPRGRDRELVPHAVGQPDRAFGHESVETARRVLHGELGGDDPRGLVMRVGAGPRILGRGRVRQQRQDDRNHNRESEADQAVSSASILSGSSTGGSGISAGYGSFSVGSRSPTESRRPPISSPTSSPCAISASAARSMASLFTFITRQSSMYAEPRTWATA